MMRRGHHHAIITTKVATFEAVAYQGIADPETAIAFLKHITDATKCLSLILDHFGSEICFFISVALASRGPCCSSVGT
jgi:hypothetical protein